MINFKFVILEKVIEKKKILSIIIIISINIIKELNK